MLCLTDYRCKLALYPYHSKIMSIAILYVCGSSIKKRTDHQLVNEKDFEKVFEEKYSGTVPLIEIN